MFRKILILLVTSLLIATYGLLITHTFAQEEKLTITTYYPSPYGSYHQLQTNQMAVGDTNKDGQLTSADQPQTDGVLLVAGSVGIGTMAPWQKLQLGGGSDANIYMDFVTDSRRWHMGVSQSGGDDKFVIQDYTAEATRFLIDTAGYVGIGTASPVTKLHIRGQDGGPNFREALRLEGQYTTLSMGEGVISADPRSGSTIKSDLSLNFLIDQDNNNTDEAIRFLTNTGDISDNSKELMRIHANGNVGIGTTDIFGGVHIKKSGQALTLETLDVNDSFDIQFYDADDLSGAYKWDLSYRGNTDPGDGSGPNALKLFTSGAGGTVMTWRYDGNVGIGTVSPQAKLDVNGRVRLQSVSAAVPGEAGNLAWFNGGACSNIGELHVRDNGVNAVLCFCGRRGGGGTLYCW